MTRKLVVLSLALAAGVGLAAAAHAKGGKAPAPAKPSAGAGYTVRFGMSQGRLGAQVMDLTEELRGFFGAPQDAGLLVGKVVADSPAAKAGVRVGDVLVEVAGQPIDDSWQVLTALADKQKGDQVSLVVIRDKKRLNLTATLDEAGFGHGLRIGKGQVDIDLDDLGALRGLGDIAIGDLDIDLGDLGAMIGKHGLALGGDAALQRKLEEANRRLEAMEKRLQELERARSK
jgi:membrane-associated protease RseP (regulator of RpoE activity)